MAQLFTHTGGLSRCPGRIRRLLLFEGCPLHGFLLHRSDLLCQLFSGSFLNTVPSAIADLGDHTPWDGLPVLTSAKGSWIGETGIQPALFLNCQRSWLCAFDAGAALVALLMLGAIAFALSFNQL